MASLVFSLVLDSGMLAGRDVVACATTSEAQWTQYLSSHISHWTSDHARELWLAVPDRYRDILRNAHRKFVDAEFAKNAEATGAETAALVRHFQDGVFEWLVVDGCTVASSYRFYDTWSRWICRAVPDWAVPERLADLRAMAFDFSSISMCTLSKSNRWIVWSSIASVAHDWLFRIPFSVESAVDSTPTDESEVHWTPAFHCVWFVALDSDIRQVFVLPDVDVDLDASPPEALHVGNVQGDHTFWSCEQLVTHCPHIVSYAVQWARKQRAIALRRDQ